MVTSAVHWTGNLQVDRFPSFTSQKACSATQIEWLDYASAKVYPPQFLKLKVSSAFHFEVQAHPWALIAGISKEQYRIGPI
jgi:hypothetical protein